MKMNDWFFNLFNTPDNYTNEQMQADHDESVALFLETYDQPKDEDV